GSAEDTKSLVELLIQREIGALWQEGDVVRVLDKSLVAREQILVLLAERGDQAPEELRNIIEYKRPGDFMKILKDLHRNRLIELAGNVAKISPTGIEMAMQ